jgi:DNA polymerase-1
MQRRLLLIDATGLIFRAYYSIKGGMTAPDGTPVNAVFGLTRMMLKVFRDVPATAAGIVFDAGRKTFRNEMFPDYKAQRPEPPDELRPQFELALETAKATQAPVFVQAGFEADDIIATLAAQAQQAGHAVTILTSDRDILQLLSPTCELLVPARGGEFKPHTLTTFAQDYGFPIERFVDFKALMGDPSDNIPGVRGIGQKGAAKLVSTYGKLEQIYANLDLVKPASMQAKLRGAREDAFLYRDLVTLKVDVPLKYDFDGRTMPDFGCDDLQNHLAEMGFNRIRDDARAAGDLMADTL